MSDLYADYQRLKLDWPKERMSVSPWTARGG